MTATDRLMIRPFTAEDFPAWYAIFSDPDLIRTFGGGLYRDEKEARDKFFAGSVGDPRRNAIVLKETGEVVGVITCCEPNPWVAAREDLKPFRGRSLSYALLPAFRGRGYAVEAARAVTEACFAEGADYVNAGFFAGNLSSEAVQKKLGFSYYGAHTYARNGDVVQVTENILWNPASAPDA
ncbi:MAG: GNAT family N-acetyltransferase [Clostridia bacterium]|nr:GNAT family N-acetyltransferase [Clostridia bacterium]